VGEMFRGFETILKGRDPLDAQQITQRICGVCPVSHGMASVLAGMAGWTSVAGRRDQAATVLDRGSFDTLGQKKEQRRMLRWHDGELKEDGSNDKRAFPFAGIPGFNLQPRRKTDGEVGREGRDKN